MELNAMTICKIFVETAKYIDAGSNKGGIIPHRTGLLQNDSINQIYANAYSGVIAIGGEKGSLAYYAPFLEYKPTIRTKRGQKPNKHYKFVERFIKSEFVDQLRKFGKVDINVN